MAMTTKQNPVDNIVLKELTTISNETQPCQVPFSIDNAACIDKPTTTDDRLDFNNSPKSNDDNFSISDGISLFGSDWYVIYTIFCIQIILFFSFLVT